MAVRRFDDYLPYNRLENVYEREGMRLGRSTLYGWLDALRELLAPLVQAMTCDARTAPHLCTDATGVLVQAPEKCKRGQEPRVTKAQVPALRGAHGERRSLGTLASALSLVGVLLSGVTLRRRSVGSRG